MSNHKPDEPAASAGETTQVPLDELAALQRERALREEVARTNQALRESERRYHQLVQDLTAAVYTCDSEGRITSYNDAAVALWGREPKLGRDLWCGSWRIYRPDGIPLPLDECLPSLCAVTAPGMDRPMKALA